MNLVALTVKILQPCRDKFGSISINSGLRVLDLNRAIGSSDKSQHCKGQAVDFDIPGISNEEVARWIKETISYDLLILEFYDGVDPNSGWVHVSYVSEEANRREALIYKKSGYSLFE